MKELVEFCISNSSRDTLVINNQSILITARVNINEIILNYENTNVIWCLCVKPYYKCVTYSNYLDCSTAYGLYNIIVLIL